MNICLVLSVKLETIKIQKLKFGVLSSDTILGIMFRASVFVSLYCLHNVEDWHSVLKCSALFSLNLDRIAVAVVSCCIKPH